MRSFGENLRKYIEESGFNIYQFARISGVNRVNIQRYIADQRLPAYEVYEAMAAHLLISPAEQEKLKASYEIARFGESLYFQRIDIKRLLESFDSIGQEETLIRSFRDRRGPIPPRPASPDPGRTVFALSGRLNIQRLFTAELEQTAYVQEQPLVYLFLPSGIQVPFLTAAFTALAFYRQRMPQVCQVFSLPKRTNRSRETERNHLDAASIALSLSFSGYFEYRPLFFYDNQLSDQNYGILYPYYAILNDCALFLSADLESGVFYSDQALVRHFQSRFECLLPRCQRILTTTGDFREWIRSLSAEGVSPSSDTGYFLSYYPCLACAMDPETFLSCLREDLEERELLLSAVREWGSSLSDPEQPHHHYFTEQGLLEFAEKGRCAGLPSGLTRPLLPELRLYLLRRLREQCAADQQILRILNPNTFRAPRHLLLNVSEADAFLYYTREDTWKVISIRESGARFALIDFLSYLPGSPYTYTKEDSLRILDSCILHLQETLGSGELSCP